MPRPLPQRFAVECVREFRLTARIRYNDAEVLAAQDRRAAAIYLWGYSVEMTLKAAYFQLVGFSPTQVIAGSDLRLALGNSPASMARQLGMTPSGNFHDLVGWADLIAQYRSTFGPQYPSQQFGDDIGSRVSLVARYWTESMRYHKNRAYGYEVAQVRGAVRWLLDRSQDV